MARNTSDVLNVTGAVGLPNPTIGSNAATNQVWGIDQNAVMLAFDNEFALRYAGNPNGNVVGYYLGRKLYDTVNNKEWICTTTGSSSVAVWQDMTSGVLTPASVASSGPVSGTTLRPTGSSAPTNGIFLPSANVIGISSNSLLVATFQSNGSGGNSFKFQGATPSVQASISAPTGATAALAGAGAGNLSTGNYAYKITYVAPSGETAVGTASNTVTVSSPGTNGKIALSSIPVSGNGTVTARRIYRTVANGATYFFVAQLNDNTTTTYTDNISDATIGGTYSAQTQQQQMANFLKLEPTPGTDTTMGFYWNTVGTTTQGGQYGGNKYRDGMEATARHNFAINGKIALTITDTYFNPAISYGGLPTSRIVISSGKFNGVTGGDNIAVISIEDELYPNPGVIDGLTIMYMAKGTNGTHHFTNNGVIAHFNVAAPSNPNGRDNYCAPESAIWINGAAAGTGGGVVFATQGSTANGTLFYDSSTGGYEWRSDNTVTPLFKLNRTASAITGISITAAASGSVPVIQPYGSATNVGVAYYTKSTGSANTHYFYDGGKLQVSIGGSSSSNAYLTLSADSSGVVLSAQNNGTANPNFTIYTVGTGDFTVLSANTANQLLKLKNNFDVIFGNSFQATGDTAGFVFMPSCNGPPTGIPASIPSNRVAKMYDRLNNQEYVYNGGWKKSAVYT